MTQKMKIMTKNTELHADNHTQAPGSLLTQAESRENPGEDIIRINTPGDRAQRIESSAQIHIDKLRRHSCEHSRASSIEIIQAQLQSMAVPGIDSGQRIQPDS